MPRRGMYILPLRAETCEGAGIGPGDAIAVTIGEDDEPRMLELPPNLVEALCAARLLEPFDAMSYSHRHEWTRAITDAKRAETRRKRIGDRLAAMRLRRH